MPSDPRRGPLEERLGKAARPFHSAVATTVEELRALLARQGAASRRQGSAAAKGGTTEDGRAGPAAAEDGRAEFGDFGARTLDFERLHDLLDETQDVDLTETARLERAFRTLSGIAVWPDGFVRAEASPAVTPRDAVAAALCRVGRAFGAARVAALIRSGRFQAEVHDSFLEEFPFALWSRVERSLAPPLLLSWSGGALVAEGLAEFLDGGVKIILVSAETGKPMPPAPLARLISPTNHVSQVLDPARLDGLLKYDGPGIAALVDDTAARFCHDPGAGPTFAERLRIEFLPEADGSQPLDGLSVAWQEESLAHLKALSQAAIARQEAAAAAPSEATDTARPAAPPAAITANGPGTDPVDRLAAWLLQQAESDRG